MMEDLALINKEAIFDKLSSLKIFEETIRCSDLIDAISISISRDKRIISKYTLDEMIIMKVDVEGTLRNCRMFTDIGIARYIQEGKIYAYENVCEYFGVETVNPYDEQVVKCLDGEGVFNTKKILNWLYGRRKKDKSAGLSMTFDKLIEWLDSNDGVIEERRRYIMNMNIIK
jgi:nitrite reductase/ring-hydroxylating ferredoxin subunit